MAAALPNKRQPDLFPEAVATILRTWGALQLAISEEFGGPDSKEKGAWLEEVTCEYFMENDGLEYFEVEEFLLTLLNQEFDTLIEDGSSTQVSKDLCFVFRECSSGHKEEVMRFTSARQGCLHQPIKLQEEENSGVEERMEDMSLQDGNEDSEQSQNGDITEDRTQNGDITEDRTQNRDVAESRTQNGDVTESRTRNGDPLEDEGWTLVTSKQKGRL